MPYSKLEMTTCRHIQIFPEHQVSLNHDIIFKQKKLTDDFIVLKQRYVRSKQGKNWVSTMPSWKQDSWHKLLNCGPGMSTCQWWICSYYVIAWCKLFHFLKTISPQSIVAVPADPVSLQHAHLLDWVTWAAESARCTHDGVCRVSCITWLKKIGG